MYDSKTDTKKHIKKVKEFIGGFSKELKFRAKYHDKSKLSNPEKEYFDIYTPKLKDCTYGSEEYKQYLEELQVALNHHYKNNKHHPEHWEYGINDMSLVDIVEMLCDWKAATLRHNDGDLLKSIEINQERFKYSDELKHIMLNEAKYMYKYRVDWYCSNGRKGVILADTVEKLYIKVRENSLLTDSEKDYIINGYYTNRLKFKTDSITIDNGFSIYWKVQY